jgi:hypothetical protein
MSADAAIGKPALATFKRGTSVQAKLVPMLVHEPVLYSGSLAKYRAPFFSRSRSTSRRRIWGRSRWISLFASISSALCFSSFELWADTPNRAEG